MSENRFEISKMQNASTLSDLLKTKVAPPSVSSSVAERIRYASRKLGWSYSRTKDHWYGNARVIHSHEMDRAEELAGLNAARSTLHEIDQYIERAESILAESDPSLAGPFAAAMRAFFSALDSARIGKPNGENRDRPDAH